MTGCTIVGCPNKFYALGWCKSHYNRHKRGMDVFAPIRYRHMSHRSDCGVDWCDREYFALDLCKLHYDRKRDGRDMNMPIRVLSKKGGFEYEQSEPSEQCKVTGCENKVYEHDMCVGHNWIVNRVGVGA